MSNWAIVAAVAVLAVTIATIGYVRYRQNETSTLRNDADLAVRLRELAGKDAVRLAAVDEFETAVYERLFYTRAIGPRVRAAAWALLAAVLSTAGVLLLDGNTSTASVVAWAAAVVLAIAFGVAAVVFVVLAVYATLTTPRVSFDESYESAEADQE
ncbi:hypothetical protein [Gordonia phthalatica]|uniref:Uncharacterized protein n=1 Tax=Gordonia phthalatica TaxID=1136941 RepID=A0A0N9N8Q8_9ACTN|nr:hypothetical protein [Gordonia phthalatica]ALG83488.1 hypothetical protein ACH46_01910 [Gordonia phthalatica]